MVCERNESTIQANNRQRDIASRQFFTLDNELNPLYRQYVLIRL